MPSVTKWKMVPPGRAHGSRTSWVRTNTGVRNGALFGPVGLPVVSGPVSSPAPSPRAGTRADGTSTWRVGARSPSGLSRSCPIGGAPSRSAGTGRAASSPASGRQLGSAAAVVEAAALGSRRSAASSPRPKIAPAARAARKAIRRVARDGAGWGRVFIGSSPRANARGGRTVCRPPERAVDRPAIRSQNTTRAPRPPSRRARRGRHRARHRAPAPDGATARVEVVVGARGDRAGRARPPGALLDRRPGAQRSRRRGLGGPRGDGLPVVPPPDSMGRSKLPGDYFEGRLATTGTARNWRTVTTLIETVGA